MPWSWWCSPELLLMRMFGSWLAMLEGRTLTPGKTNISIIDNKQNILRNIRCPRCGVGGKKLTTEHSLVENIYCVFFLDFVTFCRPFIALGIHSFSGGGERLFTERQIAPAKPKLSIQSTKSLFQLGSHENTKIASLWAGQPAPSNSRQFSWKSLNEQPQKLVWILERTQIKNSLDRPNKFNGSKYEIKPI